MPNYSYRSLIGYLQIKNGKVYQIYTRPGITNPKTQIVLGTSYFEGTDDPSEILAIATEIANSFDTTVFPAAENNTALIQSTLQTQINSILTNIENTQNNGYIQIECIVLSDTDNINKPTAKILAKDGIPGSPVATAHIPIDSTVVWVESGAPPPPPPPESEGSLGVDGFEILIDGYPIIFSNEGSIMSITVNGSPMTAAQRAKLAAVLNTNITLTESTTLVWATHGGSNLIVNSATSVVLTLPDSDVDDSAYFEGFNIGVGAISFAASGTDTIEVHAVIPETVDQYSPFQLKRITGGWLRVA